MTELIELRRLKPTKSHVRSLILTSNEIVSDSSDDESFQPLPMIINTQPISYRKHAVLVKPILPPPPIQYVPSTSFTTVAENKPLVYQRLYTPNLIEDRPLAYYRSCETPVRRLVQVQSSNEKKVHLPKHSKKLVNRFLNNLEQAHDHQHMDGNESDCSIDDCDVCRRLRLAMNDGKRRCTCNRDLYHSDHVVCEVQNSCKYDHSKYCKICNLLEQSDFAISHTKNQGKHVHVIETIPSNNKPIVEPIQFNTPGQMPLYPIGYNTYVDPTTGYTYAYDQNWQYNPNPPYIPSNPPYAIYNTAVPIVTDSSYPPTMDKATYTRMTNEDKKHNSNDKTVIVHTSRNPTPRTPKVIIEQPRRRHRLPRKDRSTTIIKERTTRSPRTKTTIYN